MHKAKVRSFRKAVDHGIKTARWDLFDKWTLKESSFVFNMRSPDPGETFPLDVFEAIFLYLKEENFLQAEKSFWVLTTIEQNWNFLTAEQKQSLLAAIPEAYPRFTNFMGRFLLAEILGEYFADRNALQILKDLRDQVIDDHRGLLAMGLGQMAREAKEESVAHEAARVVQAMLEDSSEEVREEAHIALHLIKINRPTLLEPG